MLLPMRLAMATSVATNTHRCRRQRIQVRETPRWHAFKMLEVRRQNAGDLGQFIFAATKCVFILLEPTSDFGTKYLGFIGTNQKICYHACFPGGISVFLLLQLSSTFAGTNQFFASMYFCVGTIVSLLLQSF
ncbi:hypothetical protein VPH35_066309 [Triticum aestivum]